MDRTILTLAVDSTQVGTAAAAFERMVGAGNAAAAAGGKVTAGAAAQGKAILTTLVPAATKGKTAFNELAAAAERLDPRLTQPKTILPLAQVKPQPAPQVQADAVEPKPKRTRKSVTPDAVDASATGVAKLSAESKRAKTSLDGLSTSARGTGNALTTLTSRARAAADAVKSISTAPMKAPGGIAAVFDAASKVTPVGFSQVTAAMALTAAQAARTAAAVADANRAISAPVQIRVTAAPPSARTPLVAPSPISRATGLSVPTSGTVAQLAGDAGRAQTAVERLTSAARNQRSALIQLAPAAAATAVSYRQLANTPITLAAPQGLSNAAAALANATTRANAARAAIAGLNATRAPASTASSALGAAGARAQTQQNNALAQSARQAAYQQQQLGFQLHDFFVQVSSGQSPLTALIQQGSQLSGTFGGVGGAFRAVTGLLTPARLAFGGVATAASTLALAFHESQQRSYAFAQAVALSGNVSGQTEGKVSALAQTVARQSHATQSGVRDIAHALIAIGSIGPEAFDKATEAAVHYQHATSKTAEEVAKDFAEISRAPTKAAASLSAVTANQYKEIRALEENGEKAKAAAIVYGALTAEFEKLNGKLPFFSERIQFLSKDFDNLRTALTGVFNPSVEQQIGKLEQSLASLRRSDSMDWRTLLGLDKSGAIGDLQGQLDQLNGKKKTADDKAKAEAREQDKNNKGKAASAAVRTLLDQANPQRVFDRESAALKKKFADGAAVGQPVSAADQATAMAQLKKSIMPAKAKGSSEASQVLRAQLDQDINGIQQALERESDAIEFQNRFLQGEYQAGTISLKKFYDERRTNTESAVNARIAALDKEAAREAQYLSASKDPSDKKRSQTRLNDIESEKADLRERAAQDVSLSNQEEAASFKALSEQVTNYRANLLQMQGDEAGAARLRAHSAITAAQVLARQASGIPGAEVDVSALSRAIAVTDQFNEVQRHSFLLSQNGARAEEAYGLAAEMTGKSLIEIERGIYKVRSEELVQLGALAAKARELADELKATPAMKAFAADLALEYAKAAAAVDPALSRLRDANRELAAGLANTAGTAPNVFAREYASRRLAAADDIKDQRDEYSRKIDLLEGYLATTQDKNDKARLRARIKEAEGKRDSVKGESRGSSVFKAINEAVVQPMAAQVFQTVNKLLITDPLQEYLKGQLTKLTEDKGPLAGVFKDALGIKADPKDAAMALQTAAIDANRAAMNALTQAAQAAAAALSTPIPAAGEALPAGAPARPAEAGSEASDSLLAMSRTASSAASDVSRLASAAGVGGNAMSRLPAIVNLFQSAAAAMTAANSGGSSGSGIFGAIAGLFAGADAGGMSYESAFASSGVYHSGGVVGSAPATRSVAQSVFAGAAKYHTGGIAGKAADKLKPNEVAAILMGGPKGTREEVITADDPRHRDNLSMNALAKIMVESKHEGMRVRGARELGGPVSANGMYRVNEKGPELLQVAGKQYLMTGSQGGTVTANGAGTKTERAVEVHNHFAISGPTNHASQAQIAGHAARGVRRGMRNT